MSQSLSVPAQPAMVVAHDAEREQWLVLEPASVDGMPVWQVASHHDAQAHAEHAAGLHAAAPFAWLLCDPVFGWRLASGHGWVQHLGPRCQMGEAAARAVAAREPGLLLRVWRADGRITCPDVGQ